MAVYGYARVSTAKQRIDRQVANIKGQFPAAVIIEEVYTGTRTEGRKAFLKLLGTVKAGDTIVFDEVSRMARNAEDGFQLYEKLYNMGIELVFLKEPHISTSVYHKAMSEQIKVQQTGAAMEDKLIKSVVDALNVYMMDLARRQIQIAFEQAQKEVDYLHTRTKEGVRQAMERAAADPENYKRPGGQVGGSRKIQKSENARATIRKHCKEFGGTLTDNECMSVAGVSRGTFYKLKKEEMTAAGII